MIELTLAGWTVLGTIVVMFAFLALTRIGPDIILMSALTLLFSLGIVTEKQALSGFSNPGMITVAVLFVVAEALRQTGAIGLIVGQFLKPTQSDQRARLKIMGPVAFLSAFLNNTPVVAMLVPVVRDWARKCNIPPSKLLIPLSYAAILGGVCTLIGTSTNLLVNGLLVQSGHPGMKLLDISLVGIPCAIAGVVFISIMGRWLLPDRSPAVSRLDDPRQYSGEMVVEPGSPLIGKTIEEAGLRHLKDLFLMEIDRNGQIVAAVGPQERLQENDRLVFVGVVDSIVDLQRIRGLKPATNQVFKLDSPRTQRCLIEAVVSDHCPLVGRTVREGQFRTRYNAVIIAVARSGERIRKKVGDIILRPGDTLLLEALPSFVDRQRRSRDFYLVSQLDDTTPPRHERAWLSVAILAAMVLVAAFGWLSMLKAALIAAGAMLLTGCISEDAARRNIDWRVLITIAAAIGIGSAMETSGAATAVAKAFVGLAGDNPFITLVAVYGVTTLFTEIITNNAAAVLVYPIAMAAAGDLGVNHMPYVISVMIAGSASFATPIGYQTNLMVYGPGGYRFTDFARVGLPLNLLIWAVTMAVAPLAFPFHG